MNSNTTSPIREQARERLGMTARPVPFKAAPRAIGEPVNDPVLEINRPRPHPPKPAASGANAAPAAWSVPSASGSVLAGAWMMFLDALPSMFSPMTFFFRQRVVLWQAVVYATVPLVMAALFYLTVPGQVAAYPLSGLMGWGYVAGLFVASQIVFCLFLGLCQGVGRAIFAFADSARNRARR